MPIIPIQKVDEDNSCEVEFQIVDGSETGIDVANIASAVYTLRNRLDKAVINSRTNVSFMSDIDSSGNVSISLLEADNPILSTSTKIKEEVHIMTVKVITSTSPVLTSNKEIWLRVVNFEHSS